MPTMTAMSDMPLSSIINSMSRRSHLKELGEGGQILTAVARHQDRILDTHAADAEVVQSGLNRHHMAWL
jgi:hypothetical protein